MQLLYSGLPHFIQVVGMCEKPALTLTELHPFGSLANLSDSLRRNNIDDDVRLRLRLCRDWANVLRVLHGEGPMKERRLMCDSNSVSKLLSQVLLSDDLGAVLTDMDALPEVGPGGVVCGGSKGPAPDGELLAPEQRWPFADLSYVPALMPGYTEKADIWKASIMCEQLLGDQNLPGAAWAKYRLHGLHRRCRLQPPTLRPCASQLRAEYDAALAELNRDEL
ncbi:protein O-mannose kinase-like [Neocloeon triangulifer]|uniref:protein O-mannose kinase-like n=1 Tax=Neocloeon triangulifer TaxID=2078957 RepID=UPI00286EC2CC|nr:protein O-mannose kinase-like [Neocloeon triangulifer]